ncbi:MAG: TrpB-like pyridoxal phosphate-dependent enzyme [Candidatus Lokiarchaeota archaeon]|nr:TrpB-like pyridoxal phosphate-dependent enzyme [Candidatus Lokiarchaeota archaeon]
MDLPIKTILTPEELPKQWYNILPDLPVEFPPYLNPATNEPVPGEALMELFPVECIKQEVSPERYIDIPAEIREAYYRLGRPSPLYRAKRLEEKLKTPAKIFLKREDLSPPGSHKPNTAIAQAYYARQEGIEKLTTETGAGQWGSALAYSCALMGIDLQVFMVRVSYQQKPYRKHLMNLYGANVVPSPSNLTPFGKKMLEKDSNHPGSLGIAISEAIQAAMSDDKAKYTLGSVLNHVILHQTVVGQEALLQYKKLDIVPDILIGCVGGGSNFAGFAFPAIGKKLRKEDGYEKMKIVAVEPTACPSITGPGSEYKYDFGDTAQQTPIVKMYTLGVDFVPPPIHAGGLRYHGAAPSVSLLANEKVIQSVAYPQEEIFQSAKLLAMTEGLVCAPETAHALHHAIIEAKNAKEEKIIVYNHSGHGIFDLEGFKQVLKFD